MQLKDGGFAVGKNLKSEDDFALIFQAQVPHLFLVLDRFVVIAAGAKILFFISRMFEQTSKVCPAVHNEPILPKLFAPRDPLFKFLNL